MIKLGRDFPEFFSASAGTEADTGTDKDIPATAVENADVKKYLVFIPDAVLRNCFEIFYHKSYEVFSRMYNHSF